MISTCTSYKYFLGVFYIYCIEFEVIYLLSFRLILKGDIFISVFVFVVVGFFFVLFFFRRGGGAL